MTAHLTLPYKWVDCAHPENCQEYIHLPGNAQELNRYPEEWVETINDCQINSTKKTFHTQLTGKHKNDTLILTITFLNNAGEAHKDDGPAVIQTNGILKWYQNGKLHRENGPAIEYPDGTLEWWHENMRHRDNGPAITYPNGYKEWRHHGKRHREGAPAITRADGTTEWWHNGKRHRENRPAIEKANGKQQWWTHGEFIGFQPAPKKQHDNTCQTRSYTKLFYKLKSKIFPPKLAHTRDT